MPDVSTQPRVLAGVRSGGQLDFRHRSPSNTSLEQLDCVELRIGTDIVSAIPVADVYSRSADAAFILDDEEDGDLTWFEASVAIDDSAFSSIPLGSSLDEAIGNFLAASGSFRDGYATERQRLQEVEDWCATVGDPVEAFRQSPPLVSVRAGSAQLLDGWHRMAVARHCFAMSELTVLIGDSGAFAYGPADER